MNLDRWLAGLDDRERILTNVSVTGGRRSGRTLAMVMDIIKWCYNTGPADAYVIGHTQRWSCQLLELVERYAIVVGVPDTRITFKRKDVLIINEHKLMAVVWRVNLDTNVHIFMDHRVPS